VCEYRIPGKAVEPFVACRIAQSEKVPTLLLFFCRRKKRIPAKTTTMISSSLQRLSIAFLFVFVTFFALNTGAATISKTMPVQK
jgi:hypothetical protein